MRRMEEEVESVGQREDFLSEDDHSPTDASEDSVEVKVTPVKSHYQRHSPLPTRPPSAHHHPHFQKFQSSKVSPAHQHPLSPPTHKFYHNFRKHALIDGHKGVYDLKVRDRSPVVEEDLEEEIEDLRHYKNHRHHHHQRHHHQSAPQDLRNRSQESPVAIVPSPQDFTVRASPGVVSPPVPASIRPSPPASPVEPPMGAAPLSPGTRAAARSRRKPAEPRRLCHEGNYNNNNNIHSININNGSKRCHSPDPVPKTVKAARTEGSVRDDKSVGSSPSPGAPPLLPHHPFLGHLARPPMGPFPPLLLPPAWPPVAAQWGYPRVVTPLGWPGLTPGLTPHPYPMLLPHPYPLARPLLHPHIHAAATSPPPPPPKSPPPRPPSEDQSKEDLPIPLVTRVPPPPTNVPSVSSPPSVVANHHQSLHRQPTTPSPHHHRHHPYPHPATREVSVVQKVGKAPSKFLSVESLIASDSSPSSCTTRPEPVPKASGSGTTEILSQDIADDDAPGSSSFQNDDDDSIHSLLQPNKQKQRNYKNMTRERRIEANARERNRVHTISAAFEKLRTSVPAYSHNQKLSKLSVLRIACSYILLLSRLAGHDYSEGETEPSFSECVDLTTRTIQVEGKAKKKRDE